MAQTKDTGGLGFRELETFNIALLTKMATRVSTEPDSLWVKILKGIYYPMGDLNSASKGARASWGWASLLHGRDTLIREGLWIVGDGQSIKALSDPWIYTKPGWRVEEQHGTNWEVDTKVADLIKPNRTWDEQQIRAMLCQTDADRIMQVPIPVEVRPDMLIWPYTDDGAATVRSVYHRLREAQEGNPAELNGRGDRATSIWRCIWKTNTTPSIKNFAWKMLTNSLAVQTNLVRRHMNVSPNCNMCGLQEDTEHMLFKCSWTAGVWRGTLGLSDDHRRSESIQSWLQSRQNEQCSNQETKEKRWQMCLWTCWIIWKKRCKAVFEMTEPNPVQTVEEIKKLLEEFNKLPKTIGNPGGQPARHEWQRPEPGIIKINVDAAWCHRSKKGGIGVIVRNETGAVIGDANRILTGQGIEELEAEAIRIGMHIAKEMGWNRIIVESDSKTVINQIQGRTNH